MKKYMVMSVLLLMGSVSAAERSAYIAPTVGLALGMLSASSLGKPFSYRKALVSGIAGGIGLLVLDSYRPIIEQPRLCAALVGASVGAVALVGGHRFDFSPLLTLTLGMERRGGMIMGAAISQVLFPVGKLFVEARFGK